MPVSLSLADGRSLKIIHGPAYDVKVEGTDQEIASVTSRITAGGINIEQQPDQNSQSARLSGGQNCIQVSGNNICVSGSLSGDVIINGSRIGNNGGVLPKSTLDITVTIPHADDVYLRMNGVYDSASLGVLKRLVADIGISGVDFESAQESNLTIRGNGNISGRSIKGDAFMIVTGSGNIDIDHIEGNAYAQLQGSGDITVDDGDIPVLNVMVAGSGDVSISGDIGDIIASLTGSGDIKVRHKGQRSGTISKTKVGSGDIRIKGR